jgi:hypothetical protein
MIVVGQWPVVNRVTLFATTPSYSIFSSFFSFLLGLFPFYARVSISVIGGALFRTAWRVLRLLMVKTTSRYE